ncbi:hypothetical protein HJC23_008096 [Cyclotella cryptica]|uniref:Uncharacterized protein n=1 Tax=Cyclotella cryptica TaxID=29204 RepID=A0ABD3PFX0_9STRA
MIASVGGEVGGGERNAPNNTHRRATPLVVVMVVLRHSRIGNRLSSGQRSGTGARLIRVSYLSSCGVQTIS